MKDNARQDAWRFVEPRVGMECWLFGSTLDRRIKPGTRGKIVHCHGGEMHFEVLVGKSWQVTIMRPNIDCGREWRTAKGEWLPERDPRVRKWLLRALAGPEAELARQYSTCVRTMSKEDVAWILRRNGWRVVR